MLREGKCQKEENDDYVIWQCKRKEVKMSIDKASRLFLIRIVSVDSHVSCAVTWDI